MSFTVFTYSATVLLIQPNPSHALENATQPNPTHGWTQPMSISGVDSVRIQILLVGTCRQCGSWCVAGHNHRKVIGRDPICAS